jgi:hypothetical protein
MASPNFKNGVTEFFDQITSFRNNIDLSNNSTTLFDNEKIYSII